MAKTLLLHDSQGMKRLLVLLSVAFVLIGAVMIYLVREGISLRSAPLIRPSLMTEDPAHVAKAVISRLFPDLQGAHYVVWGLPADSEESAELLRLMQDEAEKTLRAPVHILPSAETLPPESLRACPAPCWLIVSRDQANELSPGLFPETHLRPLGRAFLNVTLVPFSGTGEVSPDCVSEKRLTLDCLIPLSIHEAQRKMKKPEARYFFLRKYNERDFFLFTETP